MYRSLVMEERNIGFAASLHIETNWEDIFHPTHPLLIHWKLVSFWSPGPWCSRHWATRLRCCHEVQDSYAVCFEWQLWPVALPFLLWKLFEHVVGPSKKRSCRGFKKQPESMHDLNQNLSVLPASCDFYRFLMIFVGILLDPVGSWISTWQDIRGAPKKKSCSGAAGWLESRTAQCPTSGDLRWPRGLVFRSSMVQLEISNSKSHLTGAEVPQNHQWPLSIYVNLCQIISKLCQYIDHSQVSSWMRSGTDARWIFESFQLRWICPHGSGTQNL